MQQENENKEKAGHNLYPSTLVYPTNVTYYIVHTHSITAP